jgi:hypothetical protein
MHDQTLPAQLTGSGHQSAGIRAIGIAFKAVEEHKPGARVLIRRGGEPSFCVEVRSPGGVLTLAASLAISGTVSLKVDIDEVPVWGIPSLAAPVDAWTGRDQRRP